MRMPVCMTNAIPSCATAGKLSLHWYQLPIVRVAAAFAGRACDWGLRRMAQRAGVTFACVGAGVFVGVLADNGDPTGLYYSKRHGWHFLQDFGSSPVDSQHAIRELERLRMEGASYP